MSFGYQNLGFGAGGVASPFIEATGGTEATSGNYKTHTFSSPGTFTVTNAGKGPTNIADYFIVAGGGGGGNNGYPQNRSGGAGGGGGFRLSNSHGLPTPTMSPLINPAGGIAVSATAYPIAVGGGGAGGQPNSSSGQIDAYRGGDSTFSSITSTGGGGGPGHPLISGGVGPPVPAGPATGGSGSSTVGAGGNGNDPPFSPVQGYDSGAGFGQPTPSQFSAGGGGGAGGVGGNSSGNTGGKGGIGGIVDPAIADATPTTYGTAGPVPSVRYFAGGGGGVASGAAPDGGGGTSFTGGNVAVNTGGGGGGGVFNSGVAPNGGSGLVVIRYQFQ